MSSFALKIIALITMFTDHVSYLIFGKFSFLNYIGRIAFPIFAFQISEGYLHTKNFNKYVFRLLAFSLISQIPFMLFKTTFTDSFSLNIFFTLISGLLAIYIYDNCKHKSLGILFGILIALIAKFTKCDYGFYGVAIILIFYIFKNNKLALTLSFIFATVIKYCIPIIQYGFVIEFVYLFLATCFSITLILLYNGKKGKNTKYFLYLFYPLHLLIIYLLHTFL